MKISITKDVFKNFNPKLSISILVISNLDNKSKLKESRHLLQEMEEIIRLTFNKSTIKNHNLISPWRVAQEKYGSQAKHYHTSVERLYKKVISGRTVASKDVLTNIIKYIALKHIIPLGIDDFEKIEGDLTFTLSKGTEKVNFIQKIKKGALFYRDRKKVIGTKLDFWNNPKTNLTTKSKSALIHFDVLPPITKKKMNLILKETKGLIKTFCEGEIIQLNIDKKKNSVRI